jgi:hypothetical protein
MGSVLSGSSPIEPASKGDLGARPIPFPDDVGLPILDLLNGPETRRFCPRTKFLSETWGIEGTGGGVFDVNDFALPGVAPALAVFAGPGSTFESFRTRATTPRVVGGLLGFVVV